jgi:hypothetical protein
MQLRSRLASEHVLFSTDSTEIGFKSRIRFFRLRKTMFCYLIGSGFLVHFPTISNSTRISSLTLIDPPATVTGVIPKSFCRN